MIMLFPVGSIVQYCIIALGCEHGHYNTISVVGTCVVNKTQICVTRLFISQISVSLNRFIE